MEFSEMCLWSCHTVSRKMTLDSQFLNGFGRQRRQTRRLIAFQTPPQKMAETLTPAPTLSTLPPEILSHLLKFDFSLEQLYCLRHLCRSISPYASNAFLDKVADMLYYNYELLDFLMFVVAMQKLFVPIGSVGGGEENEGKEGRKFEALRPYSVGRLLRYVGKSIYSRASVAFVMSYAHGPRKSEERLVQFCEGIGATVDQVRHQEYGGEFDDDVHPAMFEEHSVEWIFSDLDALEFPICFSEADQESTVILPCFGTKDLKSRLDWSKVETSLCYDGAQGDAIYSLNAAVDYLGKLKDIAGPGRFLEPIQGLTASRAASLLKERKPSSVDFPWKVRGLEEPAPAPLPRIVSSFKADWSLRLLQSRTIRPILSELFCSKTCGLGTWTPARSVSTFPKSTILLRSCGFSSSSEITAITRPTNGTTI